MKEAILAVGKTLNCRSGTLPCVMYRFLETDILLAKEHHRGRISIDHVGPGCVDAYARRGFRRRPAQER
jgi:hypothetical protein